MSTTYLNIKNVCRDKCIEVVRKFLNEISYKLLSVTTKKIHLIKLYQPVIYIG